MRRAVLAVIAIAAVALVVAVAVDRLALGSALGHGSMGFSPVVDRLGVLPPEDGCGEGFGDEPCPLRLAYAPDGTVTLWLSVRNDGWLPVTLHGVSEAWLAQFADIDPLLRPRRALDGGEAIEAAANGPRRNAPRAVTLDPGEEHIIGIEFATLADVDDACARWEGGGVGFTEVPIEWSWLPVRQERVLALDPPIEVEAPTADLCA